MNLRGIFIRFVIFHSFFFSLVYGNPLEFEIEVLYKALEKLVDQGSEDQLYENRRRVCSQLREKLVTKTKAENIVSRLFSFPDLDIETYNQTINILQRKYRSLKAQNESRLSILLQLWSLLTNIKVVGLKNSGSYYENNGHFRRYCTVNSIPETFSFEFEGVNTIYIVSPAPEKIDLGKVSTTAELIDSALYYRKQKRLNKEEPIEENQQIAWDLLSDELEPLSSFTRKSGEESSLVEDFLEAVLRIDNSSKSPCYSLGLITLFQNIAVYFTLATESPRIVDSPCSIETVQYFGFQDGFFLARRGSQIKREIDYRFGLLLFRRGLSTNLYADNVRTSIFRSPIADYYPHYPLDGDLKTAALAMTGNVFAGQFRAFMQEEQRNQDSFFSKIIRTFDEQQFQIPLISREDLEQELGGVLFEQDNVVRLSGLSTRKKFKGKISDPIASAEPREDHIEPSTSNLVRHLVCWPYQNIRSIDLSDNLITDHGAHLMLDILAKRVLPLLKRINLSRNKITTLTWSDLEPLLERYYFKLFVLLGTSLQGNCTLPGDLLKKIIFCSTACADTELSKVPVVLRNEVKVSHQEYYAKYPTN